MGGDRAFSQAEVPFSSKKVDDNPDALATAEEDRLLTHLYYYRVVRMRVRASVLTHPQVGREEEGDDSD